MDIKPNGLEDSIECLVSATLQLGILPRLRIALDWTVALFFRPDLTKVDLADEHEQERRNCAAGGTRASAAERRGLGALHHA